MLSADSSISKKPLTSSFHVSQDNSNSTLSSLKISSSNIHTQSSFISHNHHDEKAALRKLYETNKLKRKSYRSNPERMWNLRMKFVQQAKKYLGIPYARKYFSHDSPEYHSKLFLDCCGLVRKVMRDLEDDFGFRIGGGNQAYHFDTLPGEIKCLEDVKPGDLVFMSGIYNTHRLKVQPHNITHVEIMVGDGSEKTIGSRWNNGTVSIFDSYKFMSKSFHSEKYYIKSIDPWLWGYCRSYCPKHSWPYNITLPKKHKSVFYSENEEKYRAKLKRDLAISREFKKVNDSKLNNIDNKKKKLKKKKKKVIKTVKSKIITNKVISFDDSKLSNEQKTTLITETNDNFDKHSERTQETFCKSEYEFQSESEESDFNSDEDENSGETSEDDSDNVEIKDTENKSVVASELANDYSRRATVLSDDEDNETIAYKNQYYRGGSNMAEHNSESEYDLSSLSDNFYYENFQPRNKRLHSKLNTRLVCRSSHQDEDSDREIEAAEENEGIIVGGSIEEYNERNNQRNIENSENSHDDNNDVECSTLSFKLLKVDNDRQ